MTVKPRHRAGRGVRRMPWIAVAAVAAGLALYSTLAASHPGLFEPPTPPLQVRPNAAGGGKVRGDQAGPGSGPSGA
ncbi:MAG: hypothetical protein M3301_08425, partial [Chloroflexota bacterium]|nr:hypothetical protein [Chloroflexota bacterium]